MCSKEMKNIQERTGTDTIHSMLKNIQERTGTDTIHSMLKNIQERTGTDTIHSMLKNYCSDLVLFYTYEAECNLYSSV